jgi:nitroimidazol reductase NimA-like FMN-containing flavoprotein (pyridoxamine 5'-phosphate oxidase superfamily)
MITAPEQDLSFCAVELGRAQCLELLGNARIARVVLSIKCLPVALPVNVSLLDEDVIFSTDSGSKLTAAVEGQVVSVEADDIDLMYRTGWSVLVTGRAQLVTAPTEIEWASSRLQAWAPGPHPFLVRVPSTLISGRRLMWDALQDTG